MRSRKESAIIMGVYVDKAGRDDLAGYVDFPGTLGLVDRPDSRNAIAGNGDIRSPALPAGAVNDLAAAQNPIGHGKTFVL
jgi:hypothetical protein